MAASKILDETSLNIVRSCAFITDVEFFLRKSQRFGDTSIRIAGDEVLKKYAQKFCHQHLEKFFPAIRATGLPHACSVYEEVLRIYRNLKADLLNKSRLKRPLNTVCTLDPVIQPEPQQLPSPAPSRVGEVPKPPTTRKRRRRRHRCARISNSKEDVNPASIPRTTSDVKSPEQGDTQDGNQKINRIRTLLEHVPSSQGSQNSNCSGQSIFPDRPSSFKKVTQQQVLEQLAKLKEMYNQLKLDNERLEGDNNTMMQHRKFVDFSLLMCQETYQEEGLSAKRVGIHQQTAQCNVVVDVLKSLRSDVDFDYFSTYYTAHRHAPPSSSWLEGVWQRKQRYKVLR